MKTSRHSAALIMLCAVGCLSACGDDDAQPPDVAGRDAGKPVAERCSDEPETLADVVSLIPDHDVNVVESHSAPSLGINRDHLYFYLQWALSPQGSSAQLSTSQGALWRVSLGGGEPEQVASIRDGSTSHPQTTAVTDREFVFIRNSGQADDAGKGTLVRLPLDGGDEETLTEADGDIRAMIVQGDDAYFADAHAIKRVALAGGAVQTVAEVTGSSLAFVHDTLYVLAEDGAYEIDADDSDVERISTEGGLNVRACGDDVCWLSGPALRMSLVRWRGAGEPEVVVGDLREPHDFVFDGTSFFIVVGHLGDVERAPAEGGTPETLDVDLGQTNLGLTNLALTDSCLYWSGAIAIGRRSRTSADAM